MKIDTIDVNDVLDTLKKSIEKEKDLSESFKALLSVLIVLVELMVQRLTRNSKNSSLAPSQDPNRDKDKQTNDQDKPKDNQEKRKPGGQNGRKYVTLEPVSTPDKIVKVHVDREKLPKGHTYTNVDYIKRQEFNISIKRHVTEYHIEVVEDEQGKRYTAESHLSRPAQYGNSVKELSVYMNVFQLIPYDRICDFFKTQGSMSLSEGSIFNFNKHAFELLETFEQIAMKNLRRAKLLHADETGINIKGQKHWLHACLNNQWTLFKPFKSRGFEAIEQMNILPHFKGILVHDHWSAYMKLKACQHAFCNAHHERELQSAIEASPTHHWAKQMKALLLQIHVLKKKAGRALDQTHIDDYLITYRAIIERGEKESPAAQKNPECPKKRGKTTQTKERNLLVRLKKYETETLRFMTNDEVPFTNNPGENDIRMTKVHQKISGCFKSMEGAMMFCRIRSYILTCQKNNITPALALETLFKGQLPDFCH